MKKRFIQVAVVGVSVLMIGSVIAFGSEVPDSGETIKVGVVYPKTGELASFGEGTEEMYGYAVDQINETGGVEIDDAMMRIELVFADSESDTTKAAEAAEDLITNEGIDIMLTSKTADTTVPVAEVCDEAGIICLSVDTPDEAWAVNDYTYAYHAGFDTFNEVACFADAWDLAGIHGGKIGVMHSDDTEGDTMIAEIYDIADKFGYEVYDPGAYTIGETDFSTFIEDMDAEGCEAVAGVMQTSDFDVFYRQVKESDFDPEVVTVGKATLFVADVNSIGEDGLADGLCSEVWWTTDFPYRSSISGEKAKAIGDAWMELVEGYDYAPAIAAYDYANVEILYNVLEEAGTLDADEIAAVCDDIIFNTCIGTISFNDQHYSVQPLVTGQWIYDGDGKWTQSIIATDQVMDMNPTGWYQKK